MVGNTKGMTSEICCGERVGLGGLNWMGVENDERNTCPWAEKKKLEKKGTHRIQSKRVEKGCVRSKEKEKGKKGGRRFQELSNTGSWKGT